MGNGDIQLDDLEHQKDVPGLIEVLKNPEEGMRIRAANALGRVGDERAIPALSAALHDSVVSDPAELFRGSPAWEEMGSDEMIDYVRNAAWDALRMIWSRTVTSFVEPSPGMKPFEVGDIVAHWKNPDSIMKGARWKVLSITRNEVALELVEGVFEEKAPFHRKRHFPGYVTRISSSDDYRHKHPGAKGNQFAFDTYRKVQ